MSYRDILLLFGSIIIGLSVLIRYRRWILVRFMGHGIIVSTRTKQTPQSYEFNANSYYDHQTPFDKLA